MALVLANRVQETSTTTGTGTLTLAGAVLGYQTFAAGIGSGNTCYYAITSSTGAWEVGIGTVGTGTLARTTLLSSSTGSLVSFTGTLNVYVTYPSEKSVNLDASGVVTGYPITVKDNVFTLQDEADPTKQAQFQLSGLATGTTYTYTLPQGSAGASTLVDAQTTQTINATKTFSNVNNTFGSATGTGTIGLASGATTTGLTKTVNIGTGGLSGSTTAITVGSANGSTTTMLGSTVIGGVAGNQSLQVNNVASAVNYLQLAGAVAGGNPTTSAQGTDTDISITYQSKGIGQHRFINAANAPLFTINTQITAANYVSLTATAATSGPLLQTLGSDTNVDFRLRTQGTGSYQFDTTSNGNTQAKITNTASAVNYLQLTGAATGAAPTLSAQGSDTNIPLVLTGKGAGVVALGGSTTTNGGFAVAPIASGVNYIIATGATTGNTPKLTSSTANIPVSIQGSNTWANFANVSAVIGVASDITNVVGAHVVVGSLNGNAPYVGASNYSTSSNSGLTLQTNGVRQFLAAHTASAVNYVQATGAVTTGAPELSAQGSDTNINLKLTPKGTGGVQFTGPLLPNNLAGTSGQVLTSAGAGAVPTWAAPVSSNITANGLFENNATISANYTIGSGNNAVSAGPITINSGVVVTVPSGSTWVVV